MILIHGSNGCAPIALETCPTLYTKFRLVANDVLAQLNKSTKTRLSMKDNSYGFWINDLINQLQLKNVTIAGFSFGGLIILKILIP
jgi:pimeloyl-ACP methyl ester carboxylesterase